MKSKVISVLSEQKKTFKQRNKNEKNIARALRCVIDFIKITSKQKKKKREQVCITVLFSSELLDARRH